MPEPRVAEVLPADWTELSAVAEIEREAFGEEALTGQQLALLARAGRIFILKAGPDTVAESIILPKGRENEFLLFSLAVRNNCRRQGFGKILLQHVLDRMTEAGAEEIELTVDPENVSAVTLYLSHFGFERRHIEKDCFGPGNDRLILCKRLTG